MKKFILIPMIFLLIGCAKKAPEILTLDLEQNASILTNNNISLYTNHQTFLSKIFRVWTTDINETADGLMWAFNSYKFSPNKKYYSESRLPRNKQWFDAQKDNANFDSFGSVMKRAITKENTPVRNFPTFDKLFLKSKAGEGYPFDYLQGSILSAFQPVLISHFSKDGAFAFVRSDALWGFVPTKNLEILSKKEAKKFMNNKFAVFIKDNEPIKDNNGNFMFYSRIGGIFPYSDENQTDFKFYDKFSIKKDYARTFQTINNKNLKDTLNSLLGQSYGWGGENSLRDCSLFIKDYFSSFGIWLPRNSKAQGKIGYVISLENLNNEQKIEIIKQYGVPFLTLLYMPGHIMIYTGEVNGKISAAHDAWGIHTKTDGRAMIGKIAITSLNIGKGYSNIEDKALLISKIKSMNIIFPNEQNEKLEP